MGNSITDSWIKAFPEYFSDNNYIDRGISGQTTPQMLVRFRADVINLKPVLVTILAGVNDIAGNTGPSTFEMIIDNISSMTELAKSNGIKVILCSVLPAYDFPWKPGSYPAEKIVELNKMIKKYADSHEIFYLDYYPSMVDSRKGMKVEYSEDGVHPNQAGYKVMMDLCSQAIKYVLTNK
jgi:lysophospholipase L1-like esterase